MDWTVDNSLYARFQTWKLKCENILEAELANFPGARFFLDGQVSKALRCTKLGAWSTVKILLPTCGLNRRISATHKLMDSELDMISLVPFSQAGSCVDEWYKF